MATGPRRVRLALDPAGFTAQERLATYEIVNTLLDQMLDLQRHFGLRAEPFQVFYLIAVSTVQRYVRAPGSAPDLRDRKPLPPTLRSGISRRRIAQVLGIPPETVRRHVAALIVAGLIEERRRGQLATPGGTLARLAAAGIPPRLAAQLVTVTNTLIRLGAVVPDR